VQGLAPVVGVALFLGGLLAIGHWARERLRGQERYLIRFTDLDCMPPPNQDRDDFLGEVRYLAEMPSQLHLLDDTLTARLAAAFARHPWVEKVERVEIVPPRQVRVTVVYRTPVLAVPHAGQLRAVDRHGILLPATTATDGLPIYRGEVHSPAGPPGTRWGDDAVEEAAHAAAERRSP
jgi:hypothetical protein